MLRWWRNHNGRTALLAVAATVSLLWGAVHILEIPLQEVLGYLLLCVAGLLVLMLPAALLAWLLVRCRRR